MDKAAEVRDCWICYNNENNTTLTTLRSEKILKNCRTYLNTSIFIKSFENETPVTYCSYCFESANQLTLLADQIQNLQKEISDLSSLFSKNVLEQRRRTGFQENGSVNKTTSPADCHGSVTKDEECENVFHSQDEIDVKCHFNESATNYATNQPIADVNAQDHQQSIRITIADLLKCLKLPKIQLKRIQSFKSRNFENNVADNTFCDIKSETNDPDNGSSFITNIENNFIPNEHVCPPESAELIFKQEHEPIFTVPINISVIAEEEKLKCEKYLDKPYKCSVCDQMFLTLNDLHDHNEKLRHYACGFCDETFPKSSSLMVHKKIHAERPFKCSSCSKAFKKADHLQKHEAFHCGKFKCSFCEKSFGNASQLKKHEKYHSVKRPYKCSLCPKSFVLASDANRHEITHTGDGLYKCSFCSKSFSLSSDAKRHEKVHTGDRPHKCSTCGKSFKRNYHLIYHRKYVHKKSKDEFILP